MKKIFINRIILVGIVITIISILFNNFVNAQNGMIDQIVSDMLNDDALNEQDEMRLLIGINNYLDEYVKTSNKEISLNNIFYIIEKLNRVENSDKLIGVFFHVVGGREIQKQFTVEERDIYIKKLMELESNSGDIASVSVIGEVHRSLYYQITKALFHNLSIPEDKMKNLDIRKYLDEKKLNRIDSLSQIIRERLLVPNDKTKIANDDRLYKSLLGELKIMMKENLINSSIYEKTLIEIKEHKYSPDKLKSEAENMIKEVRSKKKP